MILSPYCRKSPHYDPRFNKEVTFRLFGMKEDLVTGKFDNLIFTLPQYYIPVLLSICEDEMNRFKEQFKEPDKELEEILSTAEPMSFTPCPDTDYLLKDKKNLLESLARVERDLKRVNAVNKEDL